MSVLIVVTGGTIDKVYGSGIGVTDMSFPEMPSIFEILQNVNFSSDNYGVVRPFSKDSFYMTDADRQIICKICESEPDEKILITHGTDTMIETAKKIAALKLTSKTIVLTGSSRPYSVKNTDAEFNVGFALAAVLFSSPGVYIAMNGHLHKFDRCYKDQTTGVFQKL